MSKFNIQSTNEANFISACAQYSRCVERYSWKGLRSNDWNLILIIDGEDITVTSGERTMELPCASLTLIAPGYSRLFQREKKLKILWIHFQMSNYIDTIPVWQEIMPGFQQIKLKGIEFRQIYRELLEAHKLDVRRPKGWFPLACGLIENTLIRGNMIADQAKDQMDSRIVLAKELLADITNLMDMDAIAMRCGMSRAVFYLRFKEQTGISPRQYRENHQLKRAQILMNVSNYSLADIAAEVNMKDIYYLSRRFKKVYGMSPSVYREHIN